MDSNTLLTVIRALMSVGNSPMSDAAGQMQDALPGAMGGAGGAGGTAPMGPKAPGAGDQDLTQVMHTLAAQGYSADAAYQALFGKPLPPGQTGADFRQKYMSIASPGSGGAPGPTNGPMAAAPGQAPSGGPGAAAQGGPAMTPGAAGGPGGGPTPPGAAGAPYGGPDQYDTGYDPTDPGRTIRNIMGRIGLSQLGPGTQRSFNIGNIGMGQALASPGAYDVNQFPQFMSNRMAGQLPTDSNQSRIGHLMGLEGQANALLGNQPGMSLQDIVGQGKAGGMSPSDAGQMAYLASISDDPEALGSAFGSQFGGTSLSPGLTNLVGKVLGQVLQRQYDQPGGRNQRFSPFSNLNSLFSSVQ